MGMIVLFLRHQQRDAAAVTHRSHSRIRHRYSIVSLCARLHYLLSLPHLFTSLFLDVPVCTFESVCCCWLFILAHQAAINKKKEQHLLHNINVKKKRKKKKTKNSSCFVAFFFIFLLFLYKYLINTLLHA